MTNVELFDITGELWNNNIFLYQTIITFHYIAHNGSSVMFFIIPCSISLIICTK